MLETLLQRSYAINRHKQAPLLAEREAFLEHLQHQGTSRAALLSVSWQLLHVIDLLELSKLRDVGIDEIIEAGRRWAGQQRSNPRARSYDNSARYFIYVAKKWMRFACRLTSPATSRMRFESQLDHFARWLIEEQSLSPSSVSSYCEKASKFLTWFAKRHRCLSRVRLTDVDEFLTSKGVDSWGRGSVVNAAKALRSFFRHAEQLGWCRPGIARCISGPRLYVHEGLPEGPTPEDVQRLLQSVKGEGCYEIRARAIILLFAVYGLRSGEVSRLLISDFDWRAETFVVNHSKRGGTQQFPLQHEVGEAILEYIKKVRPRTAACRNLFLRINPPYRPVYSSLWSITSRRIRAAGIQCRRSGPHCLRHAFATRLLAQGVSLKKIGDLLGHRNSASTGIYAKVDMKMLRRVADFGLGGLL